MTAYGVYNDAEVTIKITNTTRPRYSTFVYYNYWNIRCNRTREPKGYQNDLYDAYITKVES